MNPLAQSALNLRDLAQRHDLVSVTVEERSGAQWTYEEGKGVRLKAGPRTLKIPEEALNGLEDRWAVAPDA